MTKDEAIKVLKMVEAHGLADKAKSVAIEALEIEAIPVEWIRKYIEEYPYMTASSMLHYWALDQALERKASERKKEKRRMSETCTDSRFEVIEQYKQKLIEDTNIEQSPREMEVLDSLLFRFWQMGWLERKEE